MIRFTALYPNQPGKRFDLEYYIHRHLALVNERLTPLGLIRYEVDEGLSSWEEDSAPPFVCISHLYFETVEASRHAFATHANELVADIPNYTDIQPLLQVNNVACDSTSIAR